MDLMVSSSETKVDRVLTVRHISVGMVVMPVKFSQS